MNKQFMRRKICNNGTNVSLEILKNGWIIKIVRINEIKFSIRREEIKSTLYKRKILKTKY